MKTNWAGFTGPFKVVNTRNGIGVLDSAGRKVGGWFVFNYCGPSKEDRDKLLPMTRLICKSLNKLWTIENPKE